jgi:CHAD domain-containing protein
MRLEQYVRTQWNTRLAKLEEQIRRAAEKPDADAIHDLRVATRRLSQVLIVFPELFANKDREEFRRKLKKLFRQAGEVRNLDVGLDLISRLGHPETAAAEQAMIPVRAHELARLEWKIARFDQRDWINWARENLIPTTSTGTALQSARTLLPQVSDAFFESGAAAVGASAKKMHQFRIAAKRFRYTLELFAELYPRDIKQKIDQIRAFQDVLGVMNDFATTREVVLHLKAGPELAEALEQGRRAKSAEFDESWGTFSQGETEVAWRQYFARPAVRVPPRKKAVRAAS